MEIITDFLVLGSGIAGLSFAIKAAEIGTVAVVTKKEKSESNTNLAQGGIATVQDKNDRFEYHIRDTLVCGAGLCKEEVVKFVVMEGPERIKELVAWGVEFTRAEGEKNAYDLGQEGGHSMRRVLHAKDLTGKEIERALSEKANANKNITFYEDHIGIDLVLKSSVTGRTGEKDLCLGAYVLDIMHNRILTFRAKYTVLATGGAGKVYLITTNPDIATGDGIAMAYRAGALIANMEFIQFHPTCLYHPEAKSFLISEAVRGEGGILKLKDGRTFMENYHPMGCLAPRDAVARAIDYEMKKSGDDCVYLDVTHLEGYRVRERFPTIYKKCLSLGMDMTKSPIPIVPAAHYTCGGVVTDLYGRTNIGRLYSAGEVACTDVHGANRLASNSLLEALVFAHTSSEMAVQELEKTTSEDISLPPWDIGNAVDSDESVVVSNNWDEIRRTMWNYVGIVRSNKRLNRAKRRIDILLDEIKEYYWNFIITSDLIELRNIATIADIIIQCAMIRKESRGLHYNIDYPRRDDINWKKDTLVQLTTKAKNTKS